MTGNTLKLAAIAAFSAVFAAAPAAHAEDVRVGVLTCHVAGGAGFIFGSSKTLSCTFDATDGQDSDYVGQINKFGLDVGYTERAVIKWAVLAPTRDFERSALAGNYVGASAEATAGVGAGANVLVGGSDDTISLQPISVQGQTGLNAAVGVAELVLRPS